MENPARSFAYSSRAWLPLSRADFSVLIGVLESLHQSYCLIHRPTHRQIIHGYLSQDALFIDDKKTPETRCISDGQ